MRKVNAWYKDISRAPFVSTVPRELYANRPPRSAAPPQIVFVPRSVSAVARDTRKKAIGA